MVFSDVTAVRSLLSNRNSQLRLIKTTYLYLNIAFTTFELLECLRILESLAVGDLLREVFVVVVLRTLTLSSVSLSLS